MIFFYEFIYIYIYEDFTNMKSIQNEIIIFMLFKFNKLLFKI